MYLVKMAARFLSKSAEDQFIKVLPQVMAKAKSYQGFLAVNFWRNYLDPDLLLEDSYWLTPAAADAWRNDPFHKHLQTLAYTSLIMENTTTFWTQEDTVKLFLKCPICDTADTRSLPLDQSHIATGQPNICKNCGYIFPLAPSI